MPSIFGPAPVERHPLHPLHPGVSMEETPQCVPAPEKSSDYSVHGLLSSVIPRLGVLGWEAAAWSRCVRKRASRRWKPGPLASCSCAPSHRKPKATGCRQTAESGKMTESGGRSQSALSACPRGGPRQPLSGTRRRGNYWREKRGRGSFHNHPPLLSSEEKQIAWASF